MIIIKALSFPEGTRRPWYVQLAENLVVSRDEFKGAKLIVYILHLNEEYVKYFEVKSWQEFFTYSIIKKIKN